MPSAAQTVGPLN